MSRPLFGLAAPAKSYALVVMTQHLRGLDKDGNITSRQLFLLMWKNYHESENTWEPFENVQNCDELLRNFWEDVGTEAMLTNMVGVEFHARPEWLQARASVAPKPAASPTKKMKPSPSRSQSRNRDRSAAGNSRTPARKQQIVTSTPSLKIHIPIASSSRAQPATDATSIEVPSAPPTPHEVATNLVTPLSPPLTPEPEPALWTQAAHPANPPARFPELSQEEPTPTLVPDDFAPRPPAPDIYLNAYSGSGGDHDPDLAELLFGDDSGGGLTWPSS
ncbi:Chromo domain-containing protein [Mycena venus]|uniref:Chromo domain-containing protein n=1 Tax=Mycena venus TaxID=2733690 RepID=A0A8H6WTA1_9AGAR|nr:Chromo domain-containing protein [Mycena venus]